MGNIIIFISFCHTIRPENSYEINQGKKCHPWRRTQTHEQGRRERVYLRGACRTPPTSAAWPFTIKLESCRDER